MANDLNMSKNYMALITMLMVVSESAKTGIQSNRAKVDKTSKVYSDYRAISAKEAELDVSQQGEAGVKETIPTPPQLLTSTQAGIISGYIISKLLSKPKIINVPKSISQPEVSAGVERFVTSCQNKYDWRLKLNKTVASMTKYGPAGVLIIPRREGIDLETISAGNGYYDHKKNEGMCILNKGYDFLMELLDIYSGGLTQMGKKVMDNPETLHHVKFKNYSIGHHDIERHCGNSAENLSGLTHAERLKAILASLPTAQERQGKTRKGPFIDVCIGCNKDGQASKPISDLEKMKVMSADYDITFNTVHVDSRLAIADEFKSDKVASGLNRKMYLIISVNGFPLVVKQITSQMIVMSDLFLTSDNEDALTLVETLEATERYNSEYHRSMLLALKDIVNQKNVFFDEDVFQKVEGRWTIKSKTKMDGTALNPRDHMVELSSPAGNIQAIASTLPSPSSLANDLTGNNAMLSAQHVKGNRTAIEGQSLTQSSESRFFVFAGNFYMNIINKLAKTVIELTVANPGWVKVYEVEKDAFVEPKVGELLAYADHYFEEQTGLIPASLGSPDAASAIINLLATVPSLAEERDLGDVVNYLAESLGFSDFPSLRRPHNRDERMSGEGAGGEVGATQSANDLGVLNNLDNGTAASQQQGLTPEEQAAQAAQSQAQQAPPQGAQQ